LQAFNDWLWKHSKGRNIRFITHDKIYKRWVEIRTPPCLGVTGGDHVSRPELMIGRERMIMLMVVVNNVQPSETYDVDHNEIVLNNIDD
jgi:hypothetical protein